MDQYVGLDLSLKETSIPVRQERKRIWRGKCPSHPRAAAEAIRKHAAQCGARRIRDRAIATCCRAVWRPRDALTRVWLRMSFECEPRTSLPGRGRSNRDERLRRQGHSEIWYAALLKIATLTLEGRSARMPILRRQLPAAKRALNRQAIS